MRRKFNILFLLVAVALFTAGCGDEGGGSPVADNGYDWYDWIDDINDVPPVTDPDPSLTEGSGAVADLYLTSKGALDDYIGWTTNVPTETKVVINLKKYVTIGNDKGFGGYVSIKFKDNGSSYTDAFSSMWMGGYPIYNTVKTNAENNKYNLLSTTYPEKPGKAAYHGFFEQVNVQRLLPPVPNQTIFSGAIILVIDNAIDLGDGQGPSAASGSIYYKNILATYPMGPLPYTNCWFISKGPYDCRTWRGDGKVDTKRSLYPNSEYKKLGNFYNLDMQKAFNNQLTN
jgi:hypothetical protein